jgi:hypothetical protein
VVEVGERVGVAVGVRLAVGVEVAVAVAEATGVRVAVGDIVNVGVFVMEGVEVGVEVDQAIRARVSALSTLRMPAPYALGFPVVVRFVVAPLRMASRTCSRVSAA